MGSYRQGLTSWRKQSAVRQYGGPIPVNGGIGVTSRSCGNPVLLVGYPTACGQQRQDERYNSADSHGRLNQRWGSKSWSVVLRDPRSGGYPAIPTLYSASGPASLTALGVSSENSLKFSVNIPASFLAWAS